jgi:hypothetical protein
LLLNYYYPWNVGIEYTVNVLAGPSIVILPLKSANPVNVVVPPMDRSPNTVVSSPIEDKRSDPLIIYDYVSSYPKIVSPLTVKLFEIVVG